MKRRSHERVGGRILQKIKRGSKDEVRTQEHFKLQAQGQA
jgi:hypothetical protein